MFQALIVTLLEKSVHRLKDELLMLENRMLENNDGMYITHDGYDTIVVYASITYKAYIPKRYDDWDVKFIEWDGGDIHLDINQQVQLR